MAFRFFIFSSALLTLMGVYFLNNVPTSIPQPLTEAAEEGEFRPIQGRESACGGGVAKVPRSTAGGLHKV